MGESSPTEQLQNVATSTYVAHWNRCTVCCLAVCLLWLTSLQISIAIVEKSVQTTTLNSVLISCEYAFHEVEREGERFARCVQQQLAVCNSALTTAFSEEKSRSDEAQIRNMHCVLERARLQSNCSTAVTTATNALRLWPTLGINRAIPYQNCSAADRLLIAAWLGEASSSARTNALISSSEYSLSFDTTANHLGTYIDDINQYNIDFVKNKTSLLSGLSIGDVSAPFVGAIEARFVALESKVSVLLSCLSLSAVPSVGTAQPCPYPTSLLAQYESLRMYVNNTVNAAVRLFKEVDLEVATVSAGISAAVAKANAFYTSVANARNALASLGIDVCEGSFPHPELCSYKMSDWFIPLPPRPSLPFFARLPDASVVWEQVKNVPVQVKAEVVNASTAMSQDVRALMNAANAALRKKTANILSDYHPPAYPYTTNVSADIKALQAKSKAFLADMSSTLAAVGTVPAIGVVTSPTDAARNASQATADLGASLLSSFRVQWASVSPFAGFSLAGWLASLATLRGALFLFDYLFRAVHTVRLVYRFLQPSVMELPPVDLGPSKVPEGGSRILQSLAEWHRRWQTAAQLLPFIYLQILALLAFLTFCIWVVAAAYVPAYDRYVGGCVTHATNDSLVSAEASSLAYNFAAMNGNSALSSGMQEYNIRVGDYCSAQQLPSQRAYDQALQATVITNRSQQADWSRVQLLSNCVDFTAMDVLFGSACCDPLMGTYGSQTYANILTGTSSSVVGVANPVATLCATVRSAAGTSGSRPQCPIDNISGLPYAPPGMTIRKSTCALSRGAQRDLSLIDSRFSCRTLPTCRVTCRGPDAALVHAVSKSCTCMSEWLVHGNILEALVAVCVYLFLNVSRVLVVKGTTLIYWRSLCPQAQQEFVVHLVANDKGEILSADATAGSSEWDVDQTHRNKNNIDDAEMVPERGEGGLGSDPVAVPVSESVPVSVTTGAEGNHLARAIGAMLRGVQWKGRLCVILGVALNAIWVTVLLLARKNVAYSP